MATSKVYLDDNGNPVQQQPKVYLDDNGNPTQPKMQLTNEQMATIAKQVEEQNPGFFETMWGAVKKAATYEKIPWSPFALGAIQLRDNAKKAEDISRKQEAAGHPIRAALATSAADANQAVGDLIGAANSPLGVAMSAAPGLGVVPRVVAGVGGAALSASQMGGRKPGESTPDVVRRNLMGAGGLTASAAAVGSEVPKISSAVKPSNVVAGKQSNVMPSAAKLSPEAIRGAEDVFRAAAPTGTKVNFRENVYKAAGDLAEIGQKIDLAEAKGGIINPDLRVRATVDAINEHLNEMYNQERVPQITRNADKPVNMGLKQIGPDSVEGLRYISKSGGDANIRAIAQKALDEKVLTVQEADTLARAANEYLKGFESMTPSERAAASATNRRMGSLKSLDVWMGKGINKVLTSSGEPGLYAYERRFAALSDIRDQLSRRMNAVELNQPGVVKGVVKPVVAAVTDATKGIASASQAAVADVNIGRTLQNGLRRLAKSGATPERPTGRAPKPEPKMLPAAPTELQPSSLVGEPSAPPHVEPTTRAERLGLLLPENTGGPYELKPSGWSGAMRQLTGKQAMQYLKAAKGNRRIAAELAERDGYKF